MQDVKPNNEPASLLITEQHLRLIPQFSEICPEDRKDQREPRARYRQARKCYAKEQHRVYGMGGTRELLN